MYVTFPFRDLELKKCLHFWSGSSYQQIGVIISKLYLTLKSAGPGDILELKHSQPVSGDDVLTVSFLNSETGHETFSTHFKTYKVEEDVLVIPDHIGYNNCFSMRSDKFYHDLKKLQRLECERVKLRQCRGPNGKGNRLEIIGINSQNHKNPTFYTDEAPVPTDALLSKNVSLERKDLEEIELTFDLQGLVSFARATVLDDNVAIHLNEDGFLILQYHVDIYGVLRFVVESQMIEEEDANYEPEKKKQRKADVVEDEEEDMRMEEDVEF